MTFARVYSYEMCYQCRSEMPAAVPRYAPTAQNIAWLALSPRRIGTLSFDLAAAVKHRHRDRARWRRRGQSLQPYAPSVWCGLI